jgi:hypothetical protein
VFTPWTLAFLIQTLPQYASIPATAHRNQIKILQSVRLPGPANRAQKTYERCPTSLDTLFYSLYFDRRGLLSSNCWRICRQWQRMRVRVNAATIRMFLRMSRRIFCSYDRLGIRRHRAGSSDHTDTSSVTRAPSLWIAPRIATGGQALFTFHLQTSVSR